MANEPLPFDAMLKAQDALLNEFIIQAKIQLQQQGSDVTGNLANSFESEGVDVDGDNLFLNYSYKKYGDYVETGASRGPGKPPPFQDIKNWIQLKRIPIPSGLSVDQWAWIVTRKIGREGSSSPYHKPKPFMQKAWQVAIDNQIENIAAAQGTDVLNATVQTWRDLGYEVKIG